MQFAMLNQEKVRPTKGVSAVCPGCSSSMVAKMGRVNVHHWAHDSLVKCDDWFEPETPWHLESKDQFPVECQEVVVRRGGKLHIADVRHYDGRVIEFQNSPISIEEIAEREHFYGRMVWVLNGEFFRFYFGAFYREDTWSFTWNWAKRSFFHARKPVIIDLGAEPGVFVHSLSLLYGARYAVVLTKHQGFKHGSVKVFSDLRPALNCAFGLPEYGEKEKRWT